jgi:intraflagellar transport protein 80
VSFSEARCTIRRADGALQSAGVSATVPLIHKNAAAGQWAKATRLCRCLKDDTLWAVLAVLALSSEQLDTAEIALSSLNEVDKAQYIQYIKTIPSVEGRNAELFLYRRRPDEVIIAFHPSTINHDYIMMYILAV